MKNWEKGEKGTNGRHNSAKSKVPLHKTTEIYFGINVSERKSKHNEMKSERYLGNVFPKVVDRLEKKLATNNLFTHLFATHNLVWAKFFNHNWLDS